jgi:hypothetical protein
MLDWLPPCMYGSCLDKSMWACGNLDKMMMVTGQVWVGKYLVGDWAG